MEKEIPNDTQIVTPGNMYLLSTVSVTLATDRAISSPPALPLAEDACSLRLLSCVWAWASQGPSAV